MNRASIRGSVSFILELSAFPITPNESYLRSSKLTVRNEICGIRHRQAIVGMTWGEAMPTIYLQRYRLRLGGNIT